MRIALMLAAFAVAVPLAAPAQPAEPLYKDVMRGSVTNLLERERRLKGPIDIGARAGWLTADEAADLRADIKLFDDDVRALAMGNVSYTPQSRFDELYARLGKMEAYVADKRPKLKPRRRR